MMSSQNDSNVTNSSSDADLKQDFSTESNSSSISKFNIPFFSRILVPHDGKETSDKAVNHAIYLSNLSEAEIVMYSTRC